MEENPTRNVTHLIDDPGNFCQDESFLQRMFFGGGDFESEMNSIPNKSYFEGRKMDEILGVGGYCRGRVEGLTDWACCYHGIGCGENGDRVVPVTAGVKHLLNFYYY